MNLHYLTLIISIIIVMIPLIYGVCLPIFKAKLSLKGTLFLNAFSSGFFLIMGILEFIGGTREELIHNNVPGWSVFLIIFLTSLVTLSLTLVGKYLIVKKTNKHNENDEHHLHENHDHLIYNINDVSPKSKLFALTLLLSHRIPGGLILGFIVNEISVSGFDAHSITYLIIFLLHIIPEELIIYYRQVEAGINKWRATFNSFLATLLLVPFIYMGAYLTTYISVNEILLAIIKVLVGCFFIFVALIEFLPEFLHGKVDSKTWYISIFLLILGISTALGILSFHSH
ncbi:MAG: hypothetical protein ACRCRZ_02370 [Metamycoplasmataceae bacterium]